MLYIYDAKKIHFPLINVDLDRNWLFAIYDFCFFLGDTSSRKIFYNLKTVFPLIFWVMALIGAVAGLSNIVFLIFLCPLLVSFCNGAMYP
jgi:uncharacterized membrane protein YtjA (UPF0391 family)